ncbi:hypothetical protein [Paenibacillus contaminans]|uniref:Uncharacterized protein n=1 Tax=Paenibacillus contaminans TaxID=450362 RepID=A0A329ML27_9BACL|nr:hypothetical protein [Paenibacillus contaminans]RAV20340.1 hypothetical protein DQG23_15320 [Paenibacillus contaminans]
MHWQIHNGGNPVSDMLNARRDTSRRHAGYPTPLAVDAGMKRVYREKVIPQEEMFRLVARRRSEDLRGYKR